MHTQPITFTHCLAIEGDYHMFAARPGGLDEDAEFSRIFYFDAQMPSDPWRHTDVPGLSVVALCVIHQARGPQRSYAALSKNGAVFYQWPGGQAVERIEDAGLHGDAPVYGYLNAIKEIGGVLYACGGGGQIYRRGAQGWRDMAGDLRQRASLLAPGLDLNAVQLGDDISDIDGYAADDLYASGAQGVYHYDGRSWSACAVPQAGIMMKILCAPDGVVWACGFDGSILRGNRAKGFAHVGHRADGLILTGMAILGEKLYFSSTQGLFFLDLQQGQGRLEKVSEIPECEDVSVADGHLLCVGPKKISVLHAGVWTELKHPDHEDTAPSGA